MRRLLVGRPIHSGRLGETLLPKSMALPIFSSDALSSVAYATEEILAVLLVASAGASRLTFPIAMAIAVLMVIVVTSYLQIIKAYPGGGGAYVVSRENLGDTAGLVAAASLLVDYTMTAVVSVVAGVFAITSAFPRLEGVRVWLSIAGIIVITVVNLRGTRESGAVFAIPTYGFIAAILLLVGVGLVRCVSGCPPVSDPSLPAPGLAATAGSVGLFAILHAFASGSTALTGVEAVSNGVTAFRHPQARNASQTLMVMLVLGLAMFVGISWLATNTVGITVSQERSVVAQLAATVFGGGAMFYVVQALTAAVLILAANTAYQGFPRLASMLAADHYMPGQFRHRGSRLVFSNGILGLGVMAAGIVWVYDADLSRLIQLYVVGVFTSFTLAQAGMVRHWLRGAGMPQQAGRRRSIAINAVGAVVTAVVLGVITFTKFRYGAWLSILAMIVVVFVLRAIRRHYDAVQEQLTRGVRAPGSSAAHHVVLLVRRPDNALARSLSYLRSFHPDSLHALYPSAAGAISEEVRRWWEEVGEGFVPLEPLTVSGELLGPVRAYVRALPRTEGDYVTVVVPESRPRGIARYLAFRRPVVRLKSGLLREPNIVVTDVPVPRDSPPHPWRPDRTVALVFVNAVNDAMVRAVNYASTLGAADTRAVYFDLDPDVERFVQDEWLEAGGNVPLDILEGPYRDLPGHMAQLVRGYTARPDTLVTVVLPELILPKWRHTLLHNQYSLLVKRLMLFESRVVLSSVPFVVQDRAGDGPKQ